MVCKDLLWVGTSAGVILTITMPRITSTTTRGSIPTPTVTGQGKYSIIRMKHAMSQNAFACDVFNKLCEKNVLYSCFLANSCLKTFS